MHKPGPVIVHFRELRGWTQYRLSKESGVAITTIRRLENGQSPKLSVLVPILDALDIDTTTRLSLVTTPAGEQTGANT